MKVVAVIPAYNEEKHIKGVAERTKKFVDGVVIMDDGSKDSTYEQAKDSGAIVVKLATNMGVGFATRTGIEIALMEGADVVVCLDADGQHDPAEIPKLLDKVIEGYDFVLASRMIDSKGMPYSKRIGNKFISACCGMFFGSRLSDTQTGFRAFTGDAYKKLRIECDGYEVCSEFAYEIVKNRLRYCEVPIVAKYDEWTKFKGTNVSTGVKIFFKILWLRITR